MLRMRGDSSKSCPCGSSQPYAACCGRYLDAGEAAASAEALMRARYVAYILLREDYLLATWHVSARPARLDLAQDVPMQWTGLQLRRHEHTDADHAVVEFVARYKVNGRAHRLHELSRFVREAYDDSAEAIRLRSGPGDPVAGMGKSFLCQGCHGTEGVSDVPEIPNLAGQYGNYIAKQVRNFQSGIRSHQIMNAMAATVENDADLADIGAYFASQPKMEGDHTSDDPVGKAIFLHGDQSRKRLACISCHGVNGKGAAPGTSMYPVLGGQKEEYIHKQLIDFRAGNRTNSPGGIMNIMARTLTDAEIDALANYLSVQ
jgi:cytochrome c553